MKEAAWQRQYERRSLAEAARQQQYDRKREQMDNNGRNMAPDNAMIERLCALAAEMRERSYVPYSKFHVGAALLAKDGRIFTGCNVENASFPMGTCAERTAFVKAVSEGAREFTAIAICGGPEDGELQYCPPCGLCRQIMAEFCEGDFLVYLAKSPADYEVYTLDEILPNRFTGSNLYA